MEPEKIRQLAEHYKAILEIIGEDVNREGLIKTPERAAKALLYVTQGYEEDPAGIIQQAVFDHDGSKIIVVKDIEFYSLCEHHILPFFGTVDVGYIPDNQIVGLSKIARLVNVFARRLQVQERLTQQICDELYKSLPAKGVMVRINSSHLCMKMRGVEKQEATTTTVAYVGKFEDDKDLRKEFFDIIK